MSISGVDYSYSLPSKNYYLSTRKAADNPANSTNKTSMDGDTFTSTTGSADSIASSGTLSAASPFNLDIEPDKTGCVRINIEDLVANANKRLSTFSEQIKQLLSEQGIDTDTPFTLGSEYGTGDVIVTSDHPDKEKIENFFSNNFELRNEFTFINNQFELAESFKEAAKFHAAYRQNPLQAVAQYSYLFQTHIESTLEISDEPTPHFERKLNL